MTRSPACAPARNISARASALAALRAPRLRPTRPALGPLRPGELAVLRDGLLDAQVLATVLGASVPVDLLRSPSQRAHALAPRVPRSAVVCAEAALWVHAGGRVPSRLALTIPSRCGSGPDTVVFRGAVPDEDVVTIAGVRLLSPARAAVDLARTAAPARAVEALLTARCLGVGNQELHLALTHCLGSACRGRPRARRLIDALVPREPRPVQVPGAAPAQP